MRARQKYCRTHKCCYKFLLSIFFLKFNKKKILKFFFQNLIKKNTEIFFPKFFLTIFFAKAFFQIVFTTFFIQNFCFENFFQFLFFFEGFTLDAVLFTKKKRTLRICYGKYNMKQAVKIGLSSLVMCRVILLTSHST